MANVIVKVLSARYVFGGKTYVRGNTFEVPAEATSRSSGINDSLSRGNIIIVGANDVVQNTSSVPAGLTQVDLGTVASEPVKMGDWPNPQTTNVTGDDFPVEEGQEIPEVAADDIIGNALKSAVKDNVEKAAAAPKTPRAAKPKQ
jgi:hypothetical protein